jgi:hypothetical protein
LESVAVDTFIKYLHQLIRTDAFDDSVIINLIDHGSRHLQIVANSRARARIQAENMDQVRRDTINEWNNQYWTDPISAGARGAERKI